MKFKYFLYLFILLLILFRGVFVNLINNINKIFFIKDDNLEIMVLNDKVNYYEKEYYKLIDFKSNLKIEENYTISNVYRNIYGYNNLVINGSNYQIGDEVITKEGLVGIVAKLYPKHSEVSLIKNTNIPVIINNEKGKIAGSNQDNNLIISDISNYNKLSLNDLVYSINGSYIGKIIEKENNEISAKVIVRTLNIDNLDYVAVISR